MCWARTILRTMMFPPLIELILAYLSKIRSAYLYVFLHSYLFGFPRDVLCVVICI